ncbi:response regulator [Cytophaga sp. FL35]|uniref:response regulator n=1 Tax=Cytophaga sp. FL35 TaxID=1904456 RepID=UPI001653B77C|nr:response regulator [Cytophaga sp. FL35]MBC6999721.1 response regulator [Cytophaga sp. FL35]
MNENVNVCIIDDDDIYQYTMSAALESINSVNRIQVFLDGAEAMDFFLDNISNTEELPDVIFLDINMPIMDGFEFMEEYVKIKPKVGKQITIYMVSSSMDPKDIERSRKISEISDYIVKPIRETQLRTIIERLKENGKI